MICKLPCTLHVSIGLLVFSLYPLESELAYLFSHGLFANKELAYYYENIGKGCLVINEKVLTLAQTSGISHSWPFEHEDDARLWIVQQPLYTFNYPDAEYGFDGSLTSLGQENEIEALALAYEKIIGKKIILAGMSRGASTILNFLGAKQPAHIAAAIIESPFDSIPDTLATHCMKSWIRFIPLVWRTSPSMLFGKFNPDGICPIKMVEHIAKELPILIIASLEDTLIPARNSASIYIKLKETGHEHVYFLLLDHGRHAYLLEDADADIYLETVHAFYEHYNLPYHKALAQKGRQYLAQCQPDIVTLTEALKINKSYIHKP